MTGSTMPLAPETHTVSGPGATAAAPPSPTTWPWAAPTRPVTPGAGYVHGHVPRTVATVLDRATDPDYPDWLQHVAGAAACRHPIRLDGHIEVRSPDGAVMATVDTVDMPDGAIYTPCGNRRAAVCPACAEVYRRDTYHLIKAGLQGDRWGIPPLHDHIALFVTATAPSFGLVHHRVVDTHAADCKTRPGCTCRPKVCHAFGRPCPHAQPTTCRQRHKTSDSQLGQPLCLDCYDHSAQVVWNHEAPELWRRTIQQVDRELRRLGHVYGVELRRRYVKVYEFQARAVVHYHILIRLDGYHPDCPDTIVPPPQQISRSMLETAVRNAFAKTGHTSAPHPGHGGHGWPIRWGNQLDVKHINAPGGEVNLGTITGYLAKYVTKSTEATGLTLRRLTAEAVDLFADPGTHTGRLVRACWTIGDHPAFWRLRRYAHQYGYGGHITTKSRRFTVTYGFLRQQRTIWRRTEGHPNTWYDQQAEQVIYRLGYHATGWITTGDALLANTAAALARERQQAGRHDLDHEAVLARLHGTGHSMAA